MRNSSRGHVVVEVSIRNHSRGHVEVNSDNVARSAEVMLMSKAYSLRHIVVEVSKRSS